MLFLEAAEKPSFRSKDKSLTCGFMKLIMAKWDFFSTLFLRHRWAIDVVWTGPSGWLGRRLAAAVRRRYGPGAGLVMVLAAVAASTTVRRAVA
jgi:hypothetical protein